MKPEFTADVTATAVAAKAGHYRRLERIRRWQYGRTRLIGDDFEAEIFKAKAEFAESLLVVDEEAELMGFEDFLAKRRKQSGT